LGGSKVAQRPQSLENLIGYFRKLPGIGERTAERLALWLLKSPEQEVLGLAEALVRLKKSIRSCRYCGGLVEEEPCPLCSDPERDTKVVCVVEAPDDLYAIENTGVYKGRYYVLQGVISPLEGMGPENLNLKPLEELCRSGQIREVILATSPTTEGEATALYLAGILEPLGVKITRIARGVPMGGDIQYTDKLSLSKAIEDRRAL
jgi:recombination protein RecR